METDERVFVKGAAIVVRWACRATGAKPCKDFYDALSSPEKAKILNIVKKFADLGRLESAEKFKKLEDGLFEFKSFQIRLLGGYQDKCFVLALGLKKKQDRHQRKDLDTAKTILTEDRKREAGPRESRNGTRR